MVCTFFGHRDAPETLNPIIEKTIIDLIENHMVSVFYVGGEGAFDRMVIRVLHRLQMEYVHIRCYRVLAYFPSDKDKDSLLETIFPDGLECVPRRYGIVHRNRWMIAQADVVITYVVHTMGGAAQFKHLAQRKGRRVIELAE
ncbi:MAG: hypothetical protein IJC17_01550 [Clostridia bacterium]|nr:hypothetical protein [Clostridia bacterium]